MIDQPEDENDRKNGASKATDARAPNLDRIIWVNIGRTHMILGFVGNAGKGGRAQGFPFHVHACQSLLGLPLALVGFVLVRFFCLFAHEAFIAFF